ncbi:hypothetical protein A3462_05760 [Enterobacter bugandensis]|nr:hypothetical protein A3462_05760 [Enterobacter bugandensis]
MFPEAKTPCQHIIHIMFANMHYIAMIVGHQFRALRGEKRLIKPFTGIAMAAGVGFSTDAQLPASIKQNPVSGRVASSLRTDNSGARFNFPLAGVLNDEA